ncbi:GNAT family N-acetyltransferase [Tistrella mobilis]
MTDLRHGTAIPNWYRAEDHFFTAISVQREAFGPKVRAYVTGVETGGLNLLSLHLPAAAPDAAAEHGVAFMAGSGLPFSLALPEDRVPVYEAWAAGYGLTPSGMTTAMMIDPANRQHRCKTAGMDLTIRAIDDLDVWGRPLAEAFGGGPEASRQYRERHKAARHAGHRLVHLTGFVDGEPVCSATLSMAGRIARLDDVGTSPAWQGRGYGSRLVDHALHLMEMRGALACCLEASVDGASLYARTGFSELFRIMIFAGDDA